MMFCFAAFNSSSVGPFVTKSRTTSRTTLRAPCACSRWVCMPIRNGPCWRSGEK